MRVANEAEFILNRMRADDVLKVQIQVLRIRIQYDPHFFTALESGLPLFKLKYISDKGTVRRGKIIDFPCDRCPNYLTSGRIRLCFAFRIRYFFIGFDTFFYRIRI